MYKVIPYEKEHLAQLKVSPEAKETVSFIGFDVMSEGFQRGPAFSAFCDDDLFMIAGVNILWPMVGEAWAMMGSDYRRHGRFLHRTTKRYLGNIAFENKLERIQAVVLKGHWAGIRWVNVLGFKYEGDMPGYFRGKTFLRYGKIYY